MRPPARRRPVWGGPPPPAARLILRGRRRRAVLFRRLEGCHSTACFPPPRVSLRELALESHSLSVPGAFNALVDALAPCRMAALSFNGCLPYNSGGAVPGIVRLLNGGSLSHLVIKGGWELDAPLMTDASAPSLATALRACVTLTSLTLNRVELWGHLSRGKAVVAALIGHPTLRVLDLSCNNVAKQHCAAVGKPLAQLVAANAPVLTVLRLAGCHLGGAGLRPLFCGCLSTHSCAISTATSTMGRCATRRRASRATCSAPSQPTAR